MLLGHTAGFTKEAPIGNTKQFDPVDFDEHVRSIPHTWLQRRPQTIHRPFDFDRSFRAEVPRPPPEEAH
jgi:hypothetical protein